MVGQSASPEYKIWEAIIQRCTNPNHPSFVNYGGRGISVCQDWRRSFEAFILEVGERPSPEYSIDRIDNDRGYEPGNVRWATRHQQSRNKRTNLRITAFGETKCLSDWATSKQIAPTTVLARLANGQSPEIALSKPATGRGYGRRSITDEQISEIRARTRDGASRAEISRQFCLPYHVVWRVASGATYKENTEQ